MSNPSIPEHTDSRVEVAASPNHVSQYGFSHLCAFRFPRTAFHILALHVSFHVTEVRTARGVRGAPLPYSAPRLSHREVPASLATSSAAVQVYCSLQPSKWPA